MHKVLVLVQGGETHRRTLSHIPSPGDCVCIRIAGKWVTLRVLSVTHNEVIEGEDLFPELVCVRIAEADTDE